MFRIELVQATHKGSLSLVNTDSGYRKPFDLEDIKARVTLTNSEFN